MTSSGPSFRVQSPTGQLTYHRIAHGETTIGRDGAVGLLLDDARISRRHARLVRAGGRVTISDGESRNGTFLNGRRVSGEPEMLAPGDVLRVGDFTLVFEPLEAAPTEVTAVFEMAPAGDPSTLSMRQVLQKAPDEGIRPPAAPEVARDISAAGLRFELDKKTRVLGLFYELSRTLGSVFSLADVYDKAIAILLQVTPADRVVIYHRLENGEFRHVASGSRDGSRLGPDDPETQPLRVSRTVFDHVATQRVSVLLADTPRSDGPVPDSVFLHKTRSVMAAPILGRASLLGVIYTDLQDALQAFSSDDLDLLNAVAVQTGVANETVRAYDALQAEAKAREKYERFLPQQLVEDLLRDPNREIRPGGTRVTLTALFGDLRGFTALSEANPPELVVERLNRFYSLMSEAIFRHGGTLDKYLGDGVLALFGAPYGTERDAVRAVRAAIDMQRAMRVFHDELAAAGQPPIGMGVGINTGTAIVGFIGSETRLDYTAIGDAVNTASRLEHLAAAGQIIISEHTMQVLDDSVRYRTLEAVQVKGRRARLGIAEVLWTPPS